MKVTVCRDAAKGKCSRPMCKYYHIPVIIPPIGNLQHIQPVELPPAATLWPLPPMKQPV